MKIIVYIATSIDGYIADEDGSIEWLNTIPNPSNDDLGWSDFINSIDAIVMGKNTFDKVLSFNIDWPYPVPVFVLSNSMVTAPNGYKDKIKIINGNPKEIACFLKKQGFNNVYIDGGKTVQQFLNDDLIDELTITKIPILLGGGIPLFSEHGNQMAFELVETKVLINQLVKIRYERKRNCP
jgi:dihydrofolate reductase